MAILEGGHIVPPPHSSYIQKPLTIRVKLELELIQYKMIFKPCYFSHLDIQSCRFKVVLHENTSMCIYVNVNTTTMGQDLKITV